ncbi:hypothetical protein [Zoogloea sp.]|uniref:DUF3024 domain-containing protein n=1 Tax=Zoogloea sp. TaxID=49181 RepID=UPI0025FBA39E|nr:hypothetical protein [Zoogloea sp.]MCK6393662.1 hypothetical protein [Zoogloea sp.]
MIRQASVTGPGELVRRRILRELEGRSRYRYVQPEVAWCDDGWLIRSPCCSRNVDPDGGVIDIARLEHPEPDVWRLYARDHAVGRWIWQASAARIEELLALVVEDAHRVFWP